MFNRTRSSRKKTASSYPMVTKSVPLNAPVLVPGPHGTALYARAFNILTRPPRETNALALFCRQRLRPVWELPLRHQIFN